MLRELWDYFRQPSASIGSVDGVVSGPQKKFSNSSGFIGSSGDEDTNETESIDLASWLHLWCGIISKANGRLASLPDWILIMAKILFRTMNRRGLYLYLTQLTDLCWQLKSIFNEPRFVAANGRLCVAELRDFYSCFLGVAPSEAHKIAKIGYLAMTGVRNHF
jgi:hypothetical protein